MNKAEKILRKKDGEETIDALVAMRLEELREEFEAVAREIKREKIHLERSIALRMKEIVEDGGILQSVRDRMRIRELEAMAVALEDIRKELMEVPADED